MRETRDTKGKRYVHGGENSHNNLPSHMEVVIIGIEFAEFLCEFGDFADMTNINNQLQWWTICGTNVENLSAIKIRIFIEIYT